MVEPLVEASHIRIFGQPETRAAADPRDTTGADDDQEPKRSHAAEQEGVRSFARTRLRLGVGGELKTSDEVVGEHAELLPGAVGPVMVGRYHVESKLPLQLGERLL